MRKIILASLAMLFYTTAAFAGIFNDNGDSTVTDFTTKLMWQQCSAGLSGTNCATGSVGLFTWAERSVIERELVRLGYECIARGAGWRSMQRLTATIQTGACRISGNCKLSQT